MSSIGVSDQYATPINPARVKSNFDSIHGMAAIKQKLLAPAQAIVAARAPNSPDPSNGILLHGEPGNGKTAFAEALAGQLDVPFLQMTYGDIASKWVGEMPRVIVNCFALATRTAPCVLFIDELDSFLVPRDASSNNAEDSKITNTLLTEVARLRQQRVVLVGATNHIAKLDTAAIREGRFDFKIEITDPDEPARLGLLRQGIAQHAPNLHILEQDLLSVARRWAGFSVARLLAIAKALPLYAGEHHTATVIFETWMGALREVQGRAGKVPPNAKRLGELVMTQHTREAIELVASRLKNVSRIEGLGGTLPSGVLFHGPSGTGKTAAAMALARDCGWAFFSTSGPELSTDRDKLLRLYREAKDAQPALVFIDEADSLLRAREYSMTPDLTNTLLVLMDGAAEKIPDVVFVAATNHPEAIDPAMLRAGRFTEKVAFTAPADDSVHRFVAQWLERKGIPGSSVDPGRIAQMLVGQTIANVEGILQYALNRAISRQVGRAAVALTVEDVQAAMRMVVA
jgi:transitional endoplasmic reticulum ATPase